MNRCRLFIIKTVDNNLNHVIIQHVRLKLKTSLDLIFNLSYFTTEASRGAETQSVTAKPTGCGFDPHLRK